ncbi:alpha/beta hydrolase [Streptomyces sp. NRRL S-241]|uniref:alpha/beta hydrolase n=1 Tax=Streptomyces sp. NRRL S-241 TaxID=1463896 RepID=UPI000A4909E3|nr:alpha/beta hydrolase [Streptomyces sp. NRRL S-241]
MPWGLPRPARAEGKPRKAEGRPCTGRTRAPRQRGEVPCRAGRARQDPEETAQGGAVITQAAAAAPAVKALVYVSAFVPDAGEVLGELAARFPGSRLEASLAPLPVPGPDGTTGVDLYIRPDRYHEVFAQDVARSTTAVLAAGQRPLSGSAFTDRVSSAAWHTVPSWTLISTRDRGIVPELQRFQASRARSRTVEVPSSHLPMHSRPDAVAALIRSAARTVTS